MHHALQVAEIFDIICKSSPRSTLACLLRTCRAFEESSRRVLWAKLDSLDPLSCLLPNSIVQEFYESNPQVVLSLSDDQWRRVKLYTSCVTDLNSIPYHQPGLLVSLAPPNALLPMFPKSRTVRVVDRGGAYSLDRPTIQLLHWMNRLAVTEFQIHASLPLRIPTPTAVELVGSLSNLFPNATRVALELTHPHTWMLDSSELHPFISNAVRSWKHLVHFSCVCYNLDVAAYRHLSELESLASLHLRAGYLQPINLAVILDASRPSPSSFPALANIQLDGYDIPMLARWISHYHLSPTCLTCRALLPDKNQTPHELFSSIGSHFDHQSLQTISLIGDLSQCVNDNIDPLTYPIQPLFAFTNLRSVVISWLWMYSLDDTDLEEIALSWPNLEVLDLHHSNVAYYDSTRPRATFKGLFTLAKNCSRLQELSIVIDARDYKWVDLDEMDDRITNRTLSKLSVIHSPIANAKQVARIIRATFPSLSQVDVGGWETLLISLRKKRKKVPPARISLWNRVSFHLAKTFPAT